MDVWWTIGVRRLHIILPDIHGAALALSSDHPPATGRGKAFLDFLMTCAVLSAATFLVTFVVMRRSESVANAYRRTAYGWLAQRVEESSPSNRAVAAFLAEEKDLAVRELDDGDLLVATDREGFDQALISNVGAIFGKVGHHGRKVSRDRIARDEPIPLIALEGSNIANVAFTVVEYA